MLIIFTLGLMCGAAAGICTMAFLTMVENRDDVDG